MALRSLTGNIIPDFWLEWPVDLEYVCCIKPDKKGAGFGDVDKDQLMVMQDWDRIDISFSVHIWRTY